MASDHDGSSWLKKLEEELESAPKEGSSAGLTGSEFQAGCEHLRRLGFTADETAAVFEVSPENVKASINKVANRSLRILFAVAAAAVLLVSVGGIAFFLRPSRTMVLDVVREEFRSPGTLHAGGSFSLKFRRLPLEAYALVVRIEPNLTAMVDFPLGPRQESHRFRQGDLLPGGSSGTFQEFSAGDSAGPLTLVVALSEKPFTDLKKDGKLQLSTFHASPNPELNRRNLRDRLVEAAVQELRKRGVADLQVLNFEVVE